MKFVILLAVLMAPQIPFAQALQPIVIPRERSHGPMEEALYTLQKIWSDEHLKMCTKLLQEAAAKLTPEELKDLEKNFRNTDPEKVRLSSTLPSKLETILKKISPSTRANNKDAMPGSSHWDVGAPYKCRVSLYQKDGLLKAYFSENAPDITLKNADGKVMVHYPAVLSGVHYDYDDQRVTLDSSKMQTILNKMNPHGDFAMSTTGIANLDKVLGQFKDRAFPKEKKPGAAGGRN